MKKLIFEEKSIAYSDFTAQVLNGFPERELAMRCRGVMGKYGADNDETNALAAELSEQIAMIVTNNRTV